MLALHVLGHVHVMHNGHGVHLSSKAEALLTYLALEGRPHHRDHLAGLLWDTPDALRNLRVELTRLRQQGLDLFAARQPMLELRCETDYAQWLAAADDVRERQLPEWLSTLRGLPLAGLEDLGSAHFRSWLDQQRSLMTDRLEDELRRVITRFSRAGRDDAAELIRARADLLGMQLSDIPDVQVRELNFEWPQALEQLRSVLLSAEDAPQLVLLHGPHGALRPVLRGLTEDTAWRVILLQAAASRLLVQVALVQHLQRARGQPVGEEPLPASTLTGDQELIQVAQLLARLGRPLVLALHDAPAGASWLGESLRFLLNLPLPLVIVLSSTSLGGVRELQQSLGAVDWTRVHRINLAPLSAAAVTRAMLVHERGLPRDLLRARSARLAQQSEGWPVYVQALLHQPVLPATPGELPDTVRELMVGELRGMLGAELVPLSRLAQIQDRFSAPRAQVVLGGDATRALAAGQEAGVLVVVSQHESLRFPHLNYRTSDAEAHLAFVNEPTRVALAGLLPPAERHAVRCQLAELLLPDDPAMSLLYAERAGLNDLAQQARDALPPLPPIPTRTSALSWCAEPPATDAPGRQLVTPNAYRVALDHGFLEVLRRGRMAPAPLLSVDFPEVPAGPWSMVLRLDVMNAPLANHLMPPSYALALRVGAGPRVMYNVQALPDYTDGENEYVFGGIVPAGSWVRLSGSGGGGRLELSVRAMDVALTVAELQWGDVRLLPLGTPLPARSGAVQG